MFVDNIDMYLESEVIFVQTLHSHVTEGSNSQKVLSIFQKKITKDVVYLSKSSVSFFSWFTAFIYRMANLTDIL